MKRMAPAMLALGLLAAAIGCEKATQTTEAPETPAGVDASNLTQVNLKVPNMT